MGRKAWGPEEGPTRPCSLNEWQEPSEDDSFIAGLCKIGARRFQLPGEGKISDKTGNQTQGFLERKQISSSLTEGSSHTTELRES